MIEKNDVNNIDGFRKCGLLFSVGLALTAWFFLWQERPGGSLFTLSAFILLFVSLFRPLVLKWPYQLWVRVSGILGLVLMNVLLTVVFVLLLAPIGLLARMLKRDILSLKMPKDGWSYWDRGPDSYWVPKKEARAGMDRYEKQY